MNLTDLNLGSYEGGICFMFDSIRAIALRGMSREVALLPTAVLKVDTTVEDFWFAHSEKPEPVMESIHWVYRKKIYRCFLRQMRDGSGRLVHFIMDEVGEEVLLFDITLSGKLLVSDTRDEMEREIIRPVFWPTK